MYFAMLTSLQIERYCRLLRGSRQRVVVVIDDLDVLYDSHRPSIIEWLPGAVATNLYMCCSLKDERSISVIRRYVEVNFEVELDVLTQEQKVSSTSAPSRRQSSSGKKTKRPERRVVFSAKGCGGKRRKEQLLRKSCRRI
jgi:hypothetical protein